MAYLTTADYLNRFGEQEAVRLTDETRSGVVDTVKVETAIADAVEIVNGYVGGRYSVPIANPPRILRSMVAALARELLHKTRPTPEVKDAADRARAQLKDVSIGRLGLPVATGEAAPVPVSDREPISSGDGPGDKFADELAAFADLGGGYYNPAWRQ